MDTSFENEPNDLSDIDFGAQDSSLNSTFFIILKNISSKNRDERFQAVQSIRKILSVENNPPIDRVIESGLVPILHNYLNDTNDSQIQYEASWALTNVASGSSEHTRYIVDNEVHKSIIDLLSTTDNLEFLEQCIWALGNIIGDSSVYRDLILNEGVVIHIIDILKKQTKKSLVSNISWTISNMCRGNPRPQFSHIKPLLPSIKILLIQWQGSEEIISDTLWALSFLTETPTDEREIFLSIIEIGLVPIIIQTIGSTDGNSVTIPGFRALGNMLSGTDDVTEELLNQNILKLFPKFLNSPRASLVKEGFWCLSNITSGPQSQIQRVIDEGLVKMALIAGQDESGSINFETKREIIWSIINAITGANTTQLGYLIENDCIKCLESNITTAQSQPNLYQFYLDAIVTLIKKVEAVTFTTKNTQYYDDFISSSFIEDIDQYRTDQFEIQFENIEVALLQLQDYIVFLGGTVCSMISDDSDSVDKQNNKDIANKLNQMDINN